MKSISEVLMTLKTEGLVNDVVMMSDDEIKEARFVTPFMHVPAGTNGFVSVRWSEDSRTDVLFKLVKIIIKKGVFGLEEKLTFHGIHGLEERIDFIEITVPSCFSERNRDLGTVIFSHLMVASFKDMRS